MITERAHESVIAPAHLLAEPVIMSL